MQPGSLTKVRSSHFVTGRASVSASFKAMSFEEPFSKRRMQTLTCNSTPSLCVSRFNLFVGDQRVCMNLVSLSGHH